MKIILTVIIIILSSTNITSIITINKYEEIIKRYVKIVKIYEDVVDSYNAKVDTAISIISGVLAQVPIHQTEIQSLKTYDLAIEPTKIERCIGIDIGLLGSFEEFKKIHDAYECEFKVDVAITLDSTTKYFTFEEFAERLEFIEWLKENKQ